MPVICVEDLTFCYNGTEVIREICFTVERGVYLAVVAVFCGILFAFVLNVPAGAMIVVFNIVFLLLVFGVRKLFTGHG
jgi:ABC-type Mn2+/Zn2+ transport system permease subunit